MEYTDLENDGLPLESRVKHLEKEASFVRNYVLGNDIYRAITLSLSIGAFVISLYALLR